MKIELTYNYIANTWDWRVSLEGITRTSGTERTVDEALETAKLCASRSSEILMNILLKGHKYELNN